MRAQDASGAKTLFVDTGVYTRNRAFRLYLSSKAGKDALLLPTGAPPPWPPTTVSCTRLWLAPS